MCISNNSFGVASKAVSAYGTAGTNNNMCISDNSFRVSNNSVRGYATRRNTNIGILTSDKGTDFDVDNSNRVGGYGRSNISVTTVNNASRFDVDNNAVRSGDKFNM